VYTSPGIMLRHRQLTAMRTEITLSQVAEHLEMIEIECRKWDRYDQLSVARLIEGYGAEQAMPGC
jgi:hypothetical protein